MIEKFHDIYVPEAFSTDNASGRIYETPEKNKYPSITTVLQHCKSGVIADWTKKVGQNEADRIKNRAASRGTSMHNLIEEYMFGKKLDKFSTGYLNFMSLKPFVNNISEIYIQEKAIYSNSLKVAGRTDVIGVYDKEDAVVDFKTSRKEKKREWIETYFIQCAFYSLAFRELTYGKFDIKKLVILISNDDGTSNEFIADRKDYEDQLLTVIDEFYELLRVKS